MVFTYKITVIGDPGVGKTSLRENFMGKTFEQTYHMTIGADFALKTVKIAFNNKDDVKEVKLQIFDLSGQPAFADVRKTYYRGTSGNLVLFDVTRSKSFSNISSWIIESQKSVGKHVPCTLIGNKADLRNSNGSECVSDEEALLKVRELTEITGYQVKYLTTSAKTGLNVEQAFKELTRSIMIEKL